MQDHLNNVMSTQERSVNKLFPRLSVTGSVVSAREAGVEERKQQTKNDAAVKNNEAFTNEVAE